MSSIDERIVALEFNNKQFENGVQQSINTLERLKNSLNLEESIKGFSGFSKAIEYTGSKIKKSQSDIKSFSLESVAQHLESITKRFSLVGVAYDATVRKMVNSALTLGKKIVTGIPNQILTGGKGRAQKIEQAKFQLKGLLGEEEFTKQWELINQNINDAVAGTAYGYDAAAAVASQLRASNIAFGDDMAHALRGVSGVAAMTNSSYEEIGHIFTTIAGQGKVMTEQLNQFANRGLNVAATLAEKLNVTEAKLREMVTKGKVDFKTFAEAMNDAFGEHATKANETFTGALSNVKASLSRMGAQFATPAYEELRKALVALIPVFKDVEKMLKPVSAAFEEYAKKVSEAAVATLNNIHVFFSEKLGIKGTDFTSVTSGFYSMFGKIEAEAKKTMTEVTGLPNYADALLGEKSNLHFDEMQKRMYSLNKKTEAQNKGLKRTVDIYEKAKETREAIVKQAEEDIKKGKDEVLVNKQKEEEFKRLRDSIEEYEKTTIDQWDLETSLIKSEKEKADATKKTAEQANATRKTVLELFGLESEEQKKIEESTESYSMFADIVTSTMGTMVGDVKKSIADSVDSEDFNKSVAGMDASLGRLSKAGLIDKQVKAVDRAKQGYQAYADARTKIEEQAADLIKNGEDEIEVNKQVQAAYNALSTGLKDFSATTTLTLNNQTKQTAGQKFTNKLYEKSTKIVGDLKDNVFKLFGIEKDENKQLKENAKEYEGIEEIAKDVILGKYGNGEERKKKLEEIGLSYAIIQNKVNELLGCEKRHAVTEEDEAKMAKYLGKSLGEAGKEAAKSKTTFEKLVDILAGMGAALNIVRMFGSALITHIIKPFMSWALPKLLDAILTPLSNLGVKLVELNKYLTDTDFFNVKFEALANGFRDIKSKVDEFFKKAGELESVQRLKEAFDALKTTLSELWNNALSKVTSGFKDLSKTIELPGMDFFLNILDAIATKLSEFFEFLNNHAGDIANFFSGMFNFIGNTGQTIWGAIAKFFGFGGKEEKDLSNADKRLQKIQTFKEKALDVFGGEFPTTNFFENILTKITGFLDKLKNLEGVQKLKAAFEKVKGVLKELWDKGLSKVKTGFDSINEEGKKPFLDKVLKVIDILTNKLSILIDFIAAHKDDIAGFFSGAYDIIRSVASAIGTFFTDLFSGKSPLEALTSAVGGENKDGKSLLDVLIGGIGSVFEKGKEVGGTFVSGFTSIFTSVTGGVSGIVEKITGFFDKLFKKVDMDKVTKGFAAGSLGILATTIATFVGKLKKGVASIADIPAKFANVLGGVGDVLSAYQNNLRADTLLKVAGAIGILTLAIVGLSFLDTDRLLAVGMSMGAVLAGLGLVIAAMALYAKASQKAKELGFARDALKANSDKEDKEDPLAPVYNSVSKFVDGMGVALAKAAKTLSKAVFLVSLAAAVGILVIAVHSLTRVDWQEALKAVGIIGLLMVELGIASAAMSKFGNEFKASNGLAIVLLAASLLILLPVLKSLAAMNSTAMLQGLAGIVTLIATLTVASVFMKGDGFLKFAGGCAILALALMLLVAPIVIFATMPITVLVGGLIALAGALVIIGLTVSSISGDKMIETAKGLAKLVASLAMLLPAMLIMGATAETAFAGIAVLGTTMLMLIGLGYLAAGIGDGLKEFAESLNDIVEAIGGFGAAAVKLGIGLAVLGQLTITFFPQMIAGLAMFGAALLALGGIGLLVGPGLTAIATPLGIISGSIIALVAAAALLPGCRDTIKNVFGEIGGIVSKISPQIFDISSALENMFNELFGVKYVSAAQDYKMALEGMDYLTDDVRTELSGKFNELQNLDGSEYSIGLQNVIGYIRSLNLSQEQIQEVLDESMKQLQEGAKEQFTIAFRDVRSKILKLHLDAEDEQHLLDEVEGLAGSVKGEFSTELDKVVAEVKDLIPDPDLAARAERLIRYAVLKKTEYAMNANKVKVFLEHTEISAADIANIEGLIQSAIDNRSHTYDASVQKVMAFLAGDATADLTPAAQIKLRQLTEESIKSATASRIALDTLTVFCKSENVGLDQKTIDDITAKIEGAAELSVTNKQQAESQLNNLLISINKMDIAPSSKKSLRELVKNAYGKRATYYSKVAKIKAYAGSVGWSNTAKKEFEGLLDNVLKADDTGGFNVGEMLMYAEKYALTDQALIDLMSAITEQINSATFAGVSLDTLNIQLADMGVEKDPRQKIMQEIQELEGLEGEEYEMHRQVIIDMVYANAANDEQAKTFMESLGIYEQESADFRTTTIESMVIAVESVDFENDEKKAEYVGKVRDLLKVDSTDIGAVLDTLLITMENDPQIPQAVTDKVRELGESLKNTFQSAYSSDLDEFLDAQAKLRRKQYLGSYVVDEKSGATVANKSEISKGMKEYLTGEEEAVEAYLAGDETKLNKVLNEWAEHLQNEVLSGKVDPEDIISSFSGLDYTDEELIQMFWPEGTSGAINPAAFREVMTPFAIAMLTGASDEFRYLMSRQGENTWDLRKYLPEMTGQEAIDKAAEYDQELKKAIPIVRSILGKTEDYTVTISDIVKVLTSPEYANNENVGMLKGNMGTFMGIINELLADYLELGEQEFNQSIMDTPVEEVAETVEGTVEKTAEKVSKYFSLGKEQRAIIDTMFQDLHPDEKLTEDKVAEFYEELNGILKELGVEGVEDLDLNHLFAGADGTTWELNPFEELSTEWSKEDRFKLWEKFPKLRELYIEWLESGKIESTEAQVEIAETVADDLEGAIEEGAEKASEETGADEEITVKKKVKVEVEGETGGKGIDIPGLVKQMLTGGEEGEGAAASKELNEAITSGIIDPDVVSSELTSQLQTAGEGVDFTQMFGEGGLEAGVNSIMNGLTSDKFDFSNLGGILEQGGIYVGGFLDGGLEKGIGLLSYLGIDAANLLGTDTVGSLETATGVSSPSKITEQIGKYFDLGFYRGIKSSSGLSRVKEAAIKLAGAAISALSSRLNEFGIAGTIAAWRFINGLTSANSSATTAGNNLSLAAENGVNERKDNWSELGENFAKGFAEGIQKQEEEVRKASARLAQEAEHALAIKAEIKSPSRVARGLGNYWGMGYVIGISEFAKKAGDAGADLADEAIDALGNPLKTIQEVLDGDIDMDPVIRPVLDLDEIQNGAKKIARLMPNPNINLGYVSASMSSKRDPNEEVVSAILGMSDSMSQSRGDTYNINGITYDDGSNITEAVKTLVRAARVERRR